MGINLSGAFYTSKAAAKNMIDRRMGKIINICSMQSELGRERFHHMLLQKEA